MRPLFFLWAPASLLFVACATAGRVQPEMPSTVQDSAADLVGTWETVVRSSGGLGTTLLFAPDNVVTLVIGAMVEADYKLEGTKVTFSSNEGGRWFSETQTVIVTGDTAVFPGDTAVFTQSGTVANRKRIRLDPGMTASGLVGRWRYIHPTGVPAYQEYTADGVMRLRVPMQVQKGMYAIDRNTIRFRILSPREESGEAQFTLRGDTLTIRRRGQRTEVYVRARPLIPYEVQQPAPPAPR